MASLFRVCLSPIRSMATIDISTTQIVVILAARACVQLHWLTQLARIGAFEEQFLTQLSRFGIGDDIIWRVWTHVRVIHKTYNTHTHKIRRSERSNIYEWWHGHRAWACLASTNACICAFWATVQLYFVTVTLRVSGQLDRDLLYAI